MKARIAAAIAAGRAQRGQGMVELSLILPVFLLLLMAMLEFGFVFDHNISLTYSTREGARTGSALVNGGGPLGCGVNQSPNRAIVDPAIIQAVDRVLSSPGSLVKRDQVTEIRIYKANSTGGQVGGNVNRYTYNTGTNTFTLSGAENWPACSRTFVLDVNGQAQDSIGVGISYTYTLGTPLNAILGFFGGGGSATLGMGDKTVMAMNPLD